MSAQPSVLPVDDARRPPIRRAVFGTVWAAGVFFVFTATKEVKPIYDHAPWLDDPYDAVISFTMFFVPLVAACLLVQVSLCLRSEPLSTARVIAILRACRVAVGAVVVDLASAWVAVALGANKSQWAVRATGAEVGLLVLATLVATKATVHLVRVPRLPSSAALPRRGRARLARRCRHRRQTREPLVWPAPSSRPGHRRLDGPLRVVPGPPSPGCCGGYHKRRLWGDGLRLARVPGALLRVCDGVGDGPWLLCDVRVPRPCWFVLWPGTKQPAVVRHATQGARRECHCLRRRHRHTCFPQFPVVGRWQQSRGCRPMLSSQRS